MPETTEVPGTGDFVDDVSSTIDIPVGSSLSVGAPSGIVGVGEAGFSVSNNSSALQRSVYDVASYFRVKPTYEVDKYFRIKPTVTVDEWPFVCDIV